MRKTSYESLPIFVITVFVAVLVGCERQVAETSASVNSDKADADGRRLLHGPIPKCDRLIGDDAEMKAYRAAAYRDCANANTVQTIMNSVGCQVRVEIGNCKMPGSRLLELSKEEEDVLNKE